MAYLPIKRIKIHIHEDLVDFQFLNKKSYQQKTGGKIKISIGCGKMTLNSYDIYFRLIIRVY